MRDCIINRIKLSQLAQVLNIHSHTMHDKALLHRRTKVLTLRRRMVEVVVEASRVRPVR